MNLFEIRGAPLYHLMACEKAIDVLEKDGFQRLWTHHTEEGTIKGVSVSRNPHFSFGSNNVVRLILDQVKLAHNHKMVPLDAERAFHNSYGGAKGANDRNWNSKHSTQYAEEFIIGGIKPGELHKYLTKIELRNTYGSRPRVMVQTIEEYSKKWNIPLSISPEVIKTKERWKREEEDDE